MLSDSIHNREEFIPMPEIIGFALDSVATKAATLKVVSTIAIYLISIKVPLYGQL